MLIHKLRQLRGTKEFFNRRCDWADVNDLLRCQHFIILHTHALANITLHTRQSKTYLVSKQFTNGTNPTISQVVNIIHTTQPFSEVQEVIHLSQNICWRNRMNSITWVSITNNSHHAIWISWRHHFEFLKNDWIRQYSCIIWNISNFIQITVQVFCNAINDTTCHNSSSFNQDFTCFWIYQRFCNRLI